MHVTFPLLSCSHHCRTFSLPCYQAQYVHLTSSSIISSILRWSLHPSPFAISRFVIISVLSTKTKSKTFPRSEPLYFVGCVTGCSKQLSLIHSKNLNSTWFSFADVDQFDQSIPGKLKSSIMTVYVYFSLHALFNRLNKLFCVFFFFFFLCVFFFFFFFFFSRQVWASIKAIK